MHCSPRTARRDGEVIDGDVAGYDYYPSREESVEWTATAGLMIVDEAYRQEDGWGYRHLLLRRPTRRGGQAVTHWNKENRHESRSSRSVRHVDPNTAHVRNLAVALIATIRSPGVPSGPPTSQGWMMSQSRSGRQPRLTTMSIRAGRHVAARKLAPATVAPPAAPEAQEAIGLAQRFVEARDAWDGEAVRALVTDDAVIDDFGVSNVDDCVVGASRAGNRVAPTCNRSPAIRRAPFDPGCPARARCRRLVGSPRCGAVHREQLQVRDRRRSDRAGHSQLRLQPVLRGGLRRLQRMAERNPPGAGDVMWGPAAAMPPYTEALALFNNTPPSS